MKIIIFTLVFLGLNLAVDAQTKIGFNTSDAFDVSGNSVAHYGMSIISGAGYNNVGLSGFYGLNFYTRGQERIKVNGNGNVGIGTANPISLLDVNGDAKIGSLNNRHYLKIASKEWPEIRFQTPLSDRLIRLGIAHTNEPYYGVFEGDFYVYTGTPDKMPLVVHKDGNVSLTPKIGNVGIGTTSPDSKLAVKGKIHAEEVKVDLSVPAPDYVFKEDYKILSIEETQNYIKENGHLPNIPSAKELEENGIELGVMNMKLLEKIEELTIYLIQQEEKLNHRNGELSEIKKEMGIVNSRIYKIENLLQSLELINHRD